MPSIDVAIPNYRYGRYLRQCVQSILAQDVSALRILIIDNASDDESQEVARALAAEDGRISLCLRERNLGPHASFNAGIDWAESDYLMIVCADDLLPPGALRRAVTVLEEEPLATVAIGAEMQVWEGHTVPPPPNSALQAGWTVLPGRRFIEAACRDPLRLPVSGSMVVRTAAQKRVGHYRAGLRYCDDFEMLLRLASLGSVARTEACQLIRREHANNMSHDYCEQRILMLTEVEKALASFFLHEGAAMPKAAALLRLARSRLGDAAYWAAASAWARSSREEAAILLRYAFTRSPRSRFLPPLAHLWRMPGAAARARAALRSLALRPT